MAKKTAPAAKSGPKKAAAPKAAKPEIFQALNVNAPGKTYPRNAEKYHVTAKVLLKVLPAKAPGLTQSEMMAAMKKAMPAEFGSTVGWWTKTAQLDLEARGQVIRDAGKPLRWRKAK